MTKLTTKLQNPIEKHFNTITRYHYFMFVFVFVSKIPIFWHVLNLIFLSPPIDYYCIYTKTNTTKNTCPCDEPSWDRSVFTETMQTKFQLLCDTDWMVSLAHIIFNVGMLIGALSFGFLSDRYGRLSMFVLSCLILSVSGCLVSYMPAASAFIFMRIIEGLGTGGAIITSYVLCIEYCGVRHREIINALFHIPINISHMTLPGMSYMLRNCDEFQLAISIPVFAFVGLRWVIMESPKWLMDKERTDDAVLVMEKFVDFNKLSCENIREEIEEYNIKHSSHAGRKFKFFQIFKHRTLTFNFIAMSLMYFLCGMGYYGVSQYIGKMSGDIHLNVAISGALLLPGTIASVFLSKLLKRRTFLMISTFFSGAFMITVVCIPNHLNFLRVFVACICNCFFFISFIIVFLFSVEIFPTSVRNSVIGVLSVLSRVGQIAAPMINTLPEITSGCIMGVLALLGTIICYVLPETKNVELPSSLDDTKKLNNKKNSQQKDKNVDHNQGVTIK